MIKATTSSSRFCTKQSLVHHRGLARQKPQPKMEKEYSPQRRRALSSEYFLTTTLYSASSAVMRKNPKTIKIAILASIKSNTCNCGFSRKGIFSHDRRGRGAAKSARKRLDPGKVETFRYRSIVRLLKPYLDAVLSPPHWKKLTNF